MLPFERKMEINRIKRQLAETDSTIIRSFEDVLKILIETNVIDKRLLPEAILKI